VVGGVAPPPEPSISLGPEHLDAVLEIDQVSGHAHIEGLVAAIGAETPTGRWHHVVCRVWVPAPRPTSRVQATGRFVTFEQGPGGRSLADPGRAAARELGDEHPPSRGQLRPTGEATRPCPRPIVAGSMVVAWHARLQEERVP